MNLPNNPNKDSRPLCFPVAALDYRILHGFAQAECHRVFSSFMMWLHLGLLTIFVKDLTEGTKEKWLGKNFRESVRRIKSMPSSKVQKSRQVTN
jgi:hypothetical protein